MFHSQLGRFVSRDPISYKSGDFDLYHYVRNSPLRRTDPTGLAGCCGQEIGGMLDSLWDRASVAFYRMMVTDPDKALWACIGKDYPWGWDIFSLLGESKYQFSTGGCGTQDCRGTVMVHGQCHWASDVNYFLWGLSNSLCGSGRWYRNGLPPDHGNGPSTEGPYIIGSDQWNESYAVERVLAWRLLSWWTGDGTTAGRVVWTRAGFHGNTTVPSTGAASKCGSCGKKAQGVMQGHFGDILILGANVFF